APPISGALPPPSKPLDDAALRRLAALALAQPRWNRWEEFADRIATKLVHVNPFEIAAWRELFQPVSEALVQPLRRIYSDHTSGEPRALAFSLLLEFDSQPGQVERPEALAGLLADADPEQFSQILRRLSSQDDHARALAAILPLINAPAQGNLALAERQARLVVALFELSRPELVWPMLIHHDEPSLRTELIHLLADYGID